MTVDLRASEAGITMAADGQSKWANVGSPFTDAHWIPATEQQIRRVLHWLPPAIHGLKLSLIGVALIHSGT